MRELVEFLVKSIVEHPDQVAVSEVEVEAAAMVEIRVAPDDVGKVIGRQGRIIQAIRTLARAAAGRDGRRVVVEVIS